jgi:hypothetical protein
MEKRRLTAKEAKTALEDIGKISCKACGKDMALDVAIDKLGVPTGTLSLKCDCGKVAKYDGDGLEFIKAFKRNNWVFSINPDGWAKIITLMSLAGGDKNGDQKKDGK